LCLAFSLTASHNPGAIKTVRESPDYTKQRTYVARQFVGKFGLPSALIAPGQKRSPIMDGKNQENAEKDNFSFLTARKDNDSNKDWNILFNTGEVGIDTVCFSVPIDIS
jgi:hypothetical protein